MSRKTICSKSESYTHIAYPKKKKKNVKHIWSDKPVFYFQYQYVEV